MEAFGYLKRMFRIRGDADERGPISFGVFIIPYLYW